MRSFTSRNFSEFKNKASEYHFEFYACAIRSAESEKQGHAFWPDGRKDYQIIIIEKGYGFFKSSPQGKAVRVGENNLILFCPGDYQDYWFEKNSNTIFYRIHFSGTQAPALLQDCGINITKRPFYTIKKAGSVRWYFEQLILLNKLDAPTKNLLLNSLTVALIYNIGRNLSGAHSLSKSYKIRRAIDYITTNPAEHHPVAFYAEMCRLSVSRFSAIFKEATNTSVKEYISGVRLECVINDFYNDRDCTLSIDEIANNNGYFNMTNFYNKFKEYTGKTPGQFRKYITKNRD